MCKQSNCTLLGHIVISSSIPVLITIASIGVWFSRTVDDGWCERTAHVTLWHIWTDSCWEDAHKTSWEDHCQWFDNAYVQDQEPKGCGMYAPGRAFHIMSLISVIVAASTACAQSCGCCCPGRKTNLFVSLGFSIAAAVTMLIAFAVFTSAREELLHVNDDAENWDYSWGWIASLLAFLLYPVTLILVCIASFVQPVPGTDDSSVNPGSGPVVVGQPVMES
mmetsp:Transcript_35310/g.82449  ORF Transcript_35310/g.82449 Transcript_35310/m.82449 type:complete len:221 (-) Transcript_35310:130-792(-)